MRLLKYTTLVLANLFLSASVDRVVADAFSFGVVLGILAKLRTKASGTRLIAQQTNGKRTDVWVDSIDILVGDARNKIAEVLRVSPVHRVSIESGNGKLVEDLSAKLSTAVHNGAVSSPDFFGFVTLTCYITIKEAEDNDRDVDSYGGEGNGNSRMPNFRSLLNIKGDAHFGDKLILTARVPNALSDSKANFYVNSFDKFAAAAPAQPSSQQVVIQLISWDRVRQAFANQDGFSETGEIVSSSSSSPAVGAFKNGKQNYSDISGLLAGGSNNSVPVRNGDQVVIECEGKYMSVTRGWWMAWSSATPRRSGAFTVEIIERAPQNIIAKNLESIKIGFETGLEKMGLPQASSTMSKDQDNILRTGDTFRLRSVKFPKFELGITNVRLRDNYYYLGLRKVAGDQPSGDESWCTEVRFAVKVNSLSTEINKSLTSKRPFFSD